MNINLGQAVLQTDRLILRIFSEADLNDLHGFTSVTGVLEMAGQKHNVSLDDTCKMLNGFISKKSVFAIVLRSVQKTIGFVGFYEDTRIRDDNNHAHLKAVEIDYLVSRDFWGHGIAVEAVNEIADFCFNDLKLDAIIATHAIENIQSKRVIEKCGFKYIKRSPFFSEATQSCCDGAMYMLFNKNLLAIKI